MRILVLYGTTDGQTEKIAMAIADVIRSEGIAADVVDARDSASVAADPYPAVIVAASVHAGGYQHAVKQWVSANLPALRRIPTVFVSVCLGVLERNPKTDAHLAQIRQAFFDASGWTPSECKVVAGALKYRTYNWLKRWAMRRIVAKAGGDTDTSRDYEYTDWDDVRAFAREFAHRRM